MTSIPSVREAASVLLDAGLSIIPIRNLDTKQPGLTAWKPYMQHLAAVDVATHWFADNGTPGAPALAVICGEVSGGLTVLDFDLSERGVCRYQEWATLVEELAPGLLARLPHVQTPSGGTHVYFRAGYIEGNTKLAETPTGETLIETRGEGGYVVAPPSPGYVKLSGSLTSIPRISVAERAILLQAARALTTRRALAEAHTKPGDAYNQDSTAGSVAALLTRHGWHVVDEHPDRITLRRPGKDKGISATIRTGAGIPIFYAFTTNGGSFTHQRGYSAFGVYATLEHAGDYSAAARTLAGLQPVAPAAPGVVQPSARTTAPAVEERPAFDWRAHVKPIKELLSRVFAPATYVIPGMIPSGATIIAGAPKTGKSLLGWQIAIAKQLGGYVFGKTRVDQGDVLYLCLEDGERLTQKRVKRMVGSGAVPEGLTYSTTWAPLLAGGIDALREYLAERPNTKLVVIDTFEPLRAPDKPGANAYRNDYSGLAPLTRLSHETGVDVLVIHHTSKMERPDPLATVNGSYGLNGAVDNVVVLQRVRFGTECMLSISGRDLDEDLQLALSYDPTTYTHTLLGDADEVGRSRLQQLVLGILKRARAPLQARDIADELGRPCDSSLRHLLGSLVRAGLALVEKRGRYKAAEKKGGEENVTCELVNCEDVNFDHGSAHGGAVAVDDPPEEEDGPPEDLVAAVDDGAASLQANLESPTLIDHKFTNTQVAMEWTAFCPECEQMATMRRVDRTTFNVVCMNCSAALDAADGDVKL